MDQVTVSRELLRQTIEALAHGHPPGCKDGMTDSGGVYPWGEPVSIPCPICKAETALRTALEQPAVEPYVWVYVNKYGVDSVPAAREWCESMIGGHGGSMFPLYTSPPPPAEVPMLSDEEILQLTPLWLKKHSNGVLIEHARAVESAVRKKAGLK